MKHRITSGMVQGMAWLAGTGPVGTRCVQCAHQRPKSTKNSVEVTCDESRPVGGKRVAFPATTPSCRKFEFRLDGGAP